MHVPRPWGGGGARRGPYVRCDLLPPIKHVQARAARES
jgi:hypothetical protein